MSEPDESSEHDPDSANFERYPDNATFKERVTWYVNHDMEDSAKALVQALTKLEDDLEWGIEFPHNSGSGNK